MPIVKYVGVCGTCGSEYVASDEETALQGAKRCEELGQPAQMFNVGDNLEICRYGFVIRCKVLEAKVVYRKSSLFLPERHEVVYRVELYQRTFPRTERINQRMLFGMKSVAERIRAKGK